MKTTRVNRTSWWSLRWLIATTLALPLATVALDSHAASGSSPHWKAGACETCHTSAAPTVEQLALKTSPGHAVCAECHDGGDASVCRHRSGISATADRVSGFDDVFQTAASDNTVSCTTCHEMKPHCERDVKQKYRNPAFLRGGPYESRADQCFACHKKSDYKQRSPHRQVRRDKILEGSCVFCHGAVPQKDDAGQWQPVSFANTGPLSELCAGCHTVGPHPSSSVTGKTGWIHMSVPSDAFRTRMEQTAISQHGRLPLDPTSGEITCATCHDPHDRKLEGMSVSETAGTRAKLRYDNICGACHAK